jgi:hypothetical protein
MLRGRRYVRPRCLWVWIDFSHNVPWRWSDINAHYWQCFLTISSAIGFTRPSPSLM